MSDSNSPTVYVLVPVHNRREITRKFVACLKEQTYSQCFLVVVDDGSIDGTAEMVQEALPNVEIVKGGGSWWWAGCMQQGYQWLLARDPAEEDMILLANDDIEFDVDFIAGAVAVLQQMPHTLLAAQLRDPKTDGVHESGIHADLRRFVFRSAEEPSQINCLPTRALIVRWTDMRQIGGFHPLLLPHYGADYEYTIRAHRLGFKCSTSPSVAICANMDTTGNHDLDVIVGWHFVRQLFSIKSPLNPIYRTSFAILATHGTWKAITVINIWARAGLRIIWQGVLRQRFPRRMAARHVS